MEQKKRKPGGENLVLITTETMHDFPSSLPVRERRKEKKRVYARTLGSKGEDTVEKKKWRREEGEGLCDIHVSRLFMSRGRTRTTRNETQKSCARYRVSRNEVG